MAGSPYLDLLAALTGQPRTSGTDPLAALLGGSAATRGSDPFSTLTGGGFGGRGSDPYSTIAAGWMPPKAKPKPPPSPDPAKPTPPAATGQAAVPAELRAISLSDLGPTQREEFYRRAMQLSTALEGQYGVPAEWLAAVAGSESNYGNTPANVLTGIKADPTDPNAVWLDTWEWENGQRVNRREPFLPSGSAYEALERTARLVTESPRYRAAFQAYQATQDREAFAQAINAAGYATDPHWARNLVIPGMQEAATYRPAMAPTVAGALAYREGLPTPPGMGARAQQVIAKAHEWVQAAPPYVLTGGATTRQAADCSGLIVGVMRELGTPFAPGVRTAEQIRLASAPVAPAQAQPGDLVFFQGTYAGNPGELATHVGIITEQGIMLDTNDVRGRPGTTSYLSPYWQQHFLEIRRPPQYGQ